MRHPVLQFDFADGSTVDMRDEATLHSSPLDLENTGLFEMIVGVLTTCHTQYTSDSSICIFLFKL